MNTYPTTDLPLGSTSPKVLYNNASNFDEAMNSDSPAWIDRFANRRDTWAGIEARATQAILNIGYESSYLPYAAGTIVLRQTQLVQRDGILYRAANIADLPLTLTGTWSVDAPKLLAVGDAPLRQDLASPTKGASIVAGAMQVVNSVAELKALSTSAASKYAEMTSYWGKGTGGGGLYYVPDSFIGLVAGPTVVAANDGGFWCLNHNGVVSFRQAGARSNGQDNTSLLQPLLDHPDVKHAVIDPGVFRVVNLTVSKAMVVSGSGPVSAIETTTLTADSLELATGVSSMTGAVFKDFNIHSAVTKTAGFGIRQSSLDGGALYLSAFKDITLSGDHFSGVKIESTVWSTLENINVKKIGVGGAGLLFRGSPGGKSASNCMVSKFRVLEGSGGTDSVGLWIDSYSEGNYFVQCTFEHPGLETGTRISDTLGSTDSVKNHFFEQLICDANSISALRIDAGRTLNFVNSWFNTCQLGDGANIAGCFDVNFTQCEFANNFHSGVLIQDTASDVTFTACLLPGNSIQGTNLYSGATINFNTNDITFNGCKFARKRGTSSNHKYSVEFKGGASQGYMVTNCQLRGFNTAAIFEGNVTANKVIANNLTA